MRWTLHLIVGRQYTHCCASTCPTHGEVFPGEYCTYYAHHRMPGSVLGGSQQNRVGLEYWRLPEAFRGYIVHGATGLLGLR